ncbi:hypothetical protein [Actinospongicola halichondriae]|uniref:hypothetical protein n=1 Tax=Actinospongicola halichondriae TaxID=3236844 RepID=UPI003D46DC58
MSIPVQLVGLADAIAARTMAPYLLTSDDDGRPHATAIVLRWEAGTLVGPCGRSTGRNGAARPAVSVLWPPDTSGDYSLIVDADMTVSGDDETRLAHLTPTHAILHRPAAVPDPATDCAHDCKPVL